MLDEEEINKKIKDAAGQYHPAYEDSAWDKMEQMLDKHLPQKKDRRRILYFLPIILLLGGGLLYIISRNEKILSVKIPEKNIAKSNSEKSKNNNRTIEPSLNTANAEEKKYNTIPNPINAGIENKPTLQTSKTLLQVYKKDAESTNDNRDVSLQLNTTKNTGIENNTTENYEILQQQNISPAGTKGNENFVDKPKTSMDKALKDTLLSKDDTKVEKIKDLNKQNKEKKTNKSFQQNFGISAVTGPDISGVKLSEAGKITVTYGAGLSYTFSGKFTLRTGFYISKKIYSVNQNEYYLQPGSTVNYYLQSVNADCKVYEIPLTLSYSFGKVKNHNWFASAGLSSYFMNRESYVYLYKYPSGLTDSKSRTVVNQNKHYFSILDISAGYEYSFNKQFSIAAEPYLKLPLSGIGLGKIKLNSAGILFTATLNPFYKK